MKHKLLLIAGFAALPLLAPAKANAETISIFYSDGKVRNVQEHRHDRYDRDGHRHQAQNHKKAHNKHANHKRARYNPHRYGYAPVGYYYKPHKYKRYAPVRYYRGHNSHHHGHRR